MPVRTGVDDPTWDAFPARLAVTVLSPVVAPADPSCLRSPFAYQARLPVSRAPRRPGVGELDQYIGVARLAGGQ